MNSSSKRQSVEEIKMDLLDSCVWKYVLTHESLANFRLDATFAVYY